MIDVNFGKRLEELRTAAGLSQNQLAKASGVSQAAISRIEKGLRSPAWEIVVALCAALNVKCDAFMVPPAKPRRKPKPKST